MEGKKEARRMWKSGRASADEGNRMIPHGEWEDYPNFIDCTMLGNRAES